MRHMAESEGPTMPPRFTPKQGQYLAFIHQYTLLNGRAPAEVDIARYVGVLPSLVHQMVVRLKDRGLIAHTPGQPRSIRVLVAVDELPPFTGQASMSRPSKAASVLERLEADEACTVLHRLLTAHPDLRAEAEQAARLLLSQVSFGSVANDVEHALRSLDLDELKIRAGRHRGGYTSPTDAAWELLQEAVDPFLADMKRQMELGLEREALAICKGVVLGLYRIRNTRRDDLLGLAEDFPAEAAAQAMRELAEGTQKGVGGKQRVRPHFGKEFVDKHLPGWSGLIARVLE